jgi:hypothetical protein
MGLLANGFRDRSGAYQTFGATASNNAYPGAHHANYHRTAAMRNLTAGEGITSDLAGIPSGNLHPNAWVMPQKAGALASRNAILGDGDFSAAITGGVNGSAVLAGTGDLSGVGQLIISMVAALSGSGTISSAVADAFLQLAATLTGSGTLAAQLTALGNLESALSGSGTVAGTTTATAIGELIASITVTGATLTTANVGDAVWNYLSEAGYTSGDSLRIVLATLAGKLSGASGTTVSIRDVNDTKDRVVATVDSSGNRTAVTLDGE